MSLPRCTIVAVIVFIINIILAGFCVYYMFFASRYYRRQIKLLDAEEAPENTQSPIRLEETPPSTARYPSSSIQSDMSVKDRAKSFLGVIRVRTAETNTSGSTLDQSDMGPPPSVTSPTIPCNRKSLAKVIIPTKKARVQPYTADPQPRYSFWGDEKLCDFEPVQAAKPLSQAQAVAM
jgi:cytoskeletal protein RodZ